MGTPEITYHSRPPMEPLPTVLARCLCHVWPVPLFRPYGRCGRCGTGVQVIGPDPQSPHHHFEDQLS